MRFVFFSMRNFEREGGGTIRMYGVLNALAEDNNEVVFISNAKNFKKFHPKIKHIPIDFEVSNQKKRLFQGMLALFPVYIVSIFYFRMIRRVEEIIKINKFEKEKVYFFEYLDNSIGYLLKKKGSIKKNINDIHGIATVEFEYQFQKARSIKEKIIYKLKYLSSSSLDKKVFNNVDAVIYASEAMKEYYENKYKSLKSRNTYILPNAISNATINEKINLKLQEKLKETYKIKDKDFVLFFAGGYKPTAGVDDLILAFDNLYKKYSDLIMILIGEGPTKDKCVRLIREKQVGDRIILIDRVPYEELITYQSLANVVICPDKQNPYSELIVHLKYFDSLSSGKIVINGGFKSVKEINKNEFLSLNFKPSNINSLVKSIEETIVDFETLTNKYKETRNYTINNLTYKSLIDRLYKEK